MTLSEMWRAKIEIRVFLLALVLVLLTMTWAGGIFGLYRYQDTRDRSADADVELCRRWVADHNQLRALLIINGIADTDYPLLSVDECRDLGR